MVETFSVVRVDIIFRVLELLYMNNGIARTNGLLLTLSHSMRAG